MARLFSFFKLFHLNLTFFSTGGSLNSGDPLYGKYLKGMRRSDLAQRVIKLVTPFISTNQRLKGHFSRKLIWNLLKELISLSLEIRVQSKIEICFSSYRY